MITIIRVSHDDKYKLTARNLQMVLPSLLKNDFTVEILDTEKVYVNSSNVKEIAKWYNR